MIAHVMKAVLAAAVLVLAAGCSSPSDVLVSPDEMTLYSVDGTWYPREDQRPKTGEEFHGDPVLSKTVIRDAAERREIGEAIKRAIENPPGGKAACFYPRHGVRVKKGGREVDYVICFQCKNFHRFEGGSYSGEKNISEEPHALLDKYLTRANVPLAPSDEEKYSRPQAP